MSDEIMVSMLFFAEENDVVSALDWKVLLYVPIVFLISWWLSSRVIKFIGPENRPSASGSLQVLFGKVASVAIQFVLLIVFIGLIYLGTDVSLTLYKIKTVAEQSMPSYFIARRSNIRKLANIYNDEVTLVDYSALDITRDSKSAGQEPLTVVLIVGESLRSDKLGINGYKRDTTALMESTDNLFSFKDVWACSTTTSVSLPCMLSDESTENWVQRFSSGDYTPKYSVSRVFTDAGFDTSFLSTANKDYALYISKDFHGTNKVVLSNELRKRFITELDDFGDLLLTDAIDANNDKDTFYALGTMGSHRDYFARYPEDGAKFTPDRGNGLTEINNAYDNTVVYFDKFIWSLTEKYKNDNAMIIYASDHGESLGENGVFLHGANIDTAPREQLAIPMIVWMSDTFVDNNPTKQANAREWEKANQDGRVRMTHDFLFHSLLDCAGFKSGTGGIDENLSVCSEYSVSKSQLVQ